MASSHWLLLNISHIAGQIRSEFKIKFKIFCLKQGLHTSKTNHVSHKSEFPVFKIYFEQYQ